MKITQATVVRLNKWITEQMSAHTLGERNKPVSAFSLVHVEAGVAEREVRTIKIGGEVEPIVIARAFYDAAMNYASEISSGSGLQQFLVYAHIEGFEAERMPHHPLKISGESNMGLTGTEPATNQGLLSQMMRHNEAFAAQIMRMSERLLQNQENIWSIQETAMTQRLETLQLTEAVISKAAEGEHQKTMEVLEHQRKTREREHMVKLAPAALSMLGLPVPQATVDTSILEAITNELSVEELQSMVSMLRMRLKPETATLLVDRMNKIIDEKSKEQANGEAKETH